MHWDKLKRQNETNKQWKGHQEKTSTGPTTDQTKDWDCDEGNKKEPVELKFEFIRASLRANMSLLFKINIS